MIYHIEIIIRTFKAARISQNLCFCDNLLKLGGCSSAILCYRRYLGCYCYVTQTSDFEWQWIVCQIFDWCEGVWSCVFVLIIWSHTHVIHETCSTLCITGVRWMTCIIYQNTTCFTYVSHMEFNCGTVPSNQDLVMHELSITTITLWLDASEYTF